MRQVLIEMLPSKAPHSLEDKSRYVSKCYELNDQPFDKEEL